MLALFLNCWTLSRSFQCLEEWQKKSKITVITYILSCQQGNLSEIDEYLSADEKKVKHFHE